MNERLARLRVPSIWASWSVAAALAAGCGGSSTPAASVDTSAPARPEHATTSEPRDADDAASPAAAPAHATCDDGTCTPCGDALCPSGWYCDEGAHGGPACGWLPECAQKASCGCVKKAFAGCSCEEQLGAAHVTCG
jgi:hypothetical protein